MKSNNKRCRLEEGQRQTVGHRDLPAGSYHNPAGRDHLHRGGLPVFPVYLCRVGGRVHPLFFIWLTYIGSAYAICDNSHTEIDVLKQCL
ncbi:MAG: hypothetical protein ACLUIR_04350 [Faecalibacterium prausnitzii]